MPTSTDLEYRASIDTSDILVVLKRVSASIDNLATEGDRDFKRIGESAKLSGVKIGAMSGFVQELTRRFVDMGLQAVGALAAAAKESVTLAADLEKTGAVFKGIFKGNEEAAVGALARIREESRALGVDLSETASNFLPFVSSLDELERVGRIASALALAQPEQGALGARIALQEALSGETLSLTRRFELPKELGNQLEAALKEGGVNQFLTEFEGILKSLGRDLDTLGDTAQISFNKAALSAEQLQTAFGLPILDELKAQFDELNETVAGNFDDYELIADAFGRILASVVEFVGTGLNDFLAGLDTEQVITIAENIFNMVSDAQALAEVLGLMELPQALLNAVDSLVEKLSRATKTALQISLIDKANSARIQAEGESVAARIREQGGVGSGFSSSVAEIFPRLGSFTVSAAETLGVDEEGAAAARAAGEAASNKVFEEGLAIFEESTKKKEENKQATKDLREEQQKSTAAGEAAANAILAQNEADRQAAKDKEALAEALAKVNDAVTKIELDSARKRADALRKASADRSKLELDFSRSREKDERELQRRLKDIEAEGEDEKGKKAAKIQQDFSQKRVDIHRDFRQQIEDINRRFDLAQEEAELERDALSFLRNEKQRQQELQSATVDRDRSLGDTNIEEGRAQAELATLDDELQKKLDKERESFARRREEAEIAKQQRLEDLALAQQEEEEKIRIAEERKLEDLLNSSQKELAIIEEMTGAQIDLVTEREQLRTLIVQQETEKRIEALQKEVKAAEEAALALAAVQARSSTQSFLRQQVTGRGRQTPARTGLFGVAAGFAEGTDGQFLTVPAGHPNDSFRVGLTTGEKFAVLPAGPQPLPQLPGSAAQIINNRQQQIEQLNFGGSLDLIERLTAMEQAIEMLTRLKR